MVCLAVEISAFIYALRGMSGGSTQLWLNNITNSIGVFSTALLAAFFLIGDYPKKDQIIFILFIYLLVNALTIYRLLPL